MGTPEAPTGWEDFFCCAPGQTQAPCNKGHVEKNCASAGPPNWQVAVVLHKETSQQPAAGTRRSCRLASKHTPPPCSKIARSAAHAAAAPAKSLKTEATTQFVFNV